MDRLDTVRRAAAYIEAHLSQDVTAADAAREVHLSPFYFSRAFTAVSGCSVGEYIRGRRLYLAALRLAGGSARVLDAALDAGYDSPESFARAFRRQFGASPTEVRRTGRVPKPFLPLHITEQVQGGTNMDVRMEKLDAFKVVGVSRRFTGETSNREIPAWFEQLEAAGKTDPALAALGSIAVCIDDNGEEDFAYWVARPYAGGAVPEGQAVLEIPARCWAIFTATGPLPGALQTVNAAIFAEWLPGNPDWAPDGDMTVENYLPGDMDAPDYRCEVWVPVRPRT